MSFLKLLISSQNRSIVTAIHRRFLSASIDSGKLFSEKHEWIKVDTQSKVGCVGISHHAQDTLGDVVFVQNPDVGSTYSQFDEVGSIESVKAASELLTPVSGSIVEVNDKLESKPSLVNTDCYGDGWLFKIKLDDEKELDKLMNETQYGSYVEKGGDV